MLMRRIGLVAGALAILFTARGAARAATVAPIVNSPAANAVVARTLLTGWSSGGREAMLSALAPDAVWRAPQSSADAGFPVPLIGAETITDRITGAFGNYASLHMVIENMIAEGDTVATMLTLSGQRKTGVQYDNRYLFFMRFSNGRAVEIYESTDTAHAFKVQGIGVKK